MLGKLNLRSLFLGVAKVAMGEAKVKDVLRDIRKDSGLNRQQFKELCNLELSYEVSHYLVDLWSVYASKDIRLMRIFTTCDFGEWMDVFCTYGNLIDFVQAGEYMKSRLDWHNKMNSKIKEMEEDIKNMQYYQERLNRIVESAECIIKLIPTPRSNNREPVAQERKDKEVYLLSNGIYMKIGITNDIKKRISTLQTANPTKIECISRYTPTKTTALNIEQRIHEYFKNFRVCGEWFDINLNQEKFDNLCSMFDN